MERLFDFKNTIDDSVRTVSRDFIKKNRPELLKKSKVVAVKIYTDDDLAKIGTEIQQQAKAKVKAKTSRKGALRATVFDLFHSGAPVGDVAKTLGITYANAHYYKRAFKKEFG